MRSKRVVVSLLVVLVLLIALLPPSADAAVPLAYQVRPGDYLCKIALEHDVSCQEVINLNPQFEDPSLIHAGQWVFLPEDADISQGHRFGFLTAMQSELEGQLSMMENVQTYRVSGRVFYTGEFEDRPVVMAMSEVGLNNAAITTQALFEHFDTCPVIFSGIAGAGPGVEIGDVMIAAGVTQHDYGAFLDVQYEEGLHREQVWWGWTERGIADSGSFDARLLQPDEDFYNLVWEAASQVQLPEVSEGVAEYLTRVRGEQVNIYQPSVIQGYIASGNQFIWSYLTLETIGARLARLLAELGLPERQLAVEMEGYSFALACETNACDQWAIVRVMSDEARQPDVTEGIPSEALGDPQGITDWAMEHGLGDTFANVGPVFGTISLVDQAIVRALAQ